MNPDTEEVMPRSGTRGLEEQSHEYTFIMHPPYKEQQIARISATKHPYKSEAHCTSARAFGDMRVRESSDLRFEIPLPYSFGGGGPEVEFLLEVLVAVVLLFVELEVLEFVVEFVEVVDLGEFGLELGIEGLVVLPDGFHIQIIGGAQSKSNGIYAGFAIIMKEESKSWRTHNPYEEVYRSYNLATGEYTTREDAEAITRHLGLLHNAFGVVIKDFVNILKFKFPEDRSTSEPMVDELKQEEAVEELIQENIREARRECRQPVALLEQLQPEKNYIKSRTPVSASSHNSPPDNKARGTPPDNKARGTPQLSSGFDPMRFEYRPDGPTSEMNGESQPPRHAEPERGKQSEIIQLDD